MDVRRADRIADALEEMVFTGHLREGQRLDEATLAKKFDVSRTPIREALQRLVAADLARQLPRRGVFVQQPSSITLIEMFETMAEIEGVCGRLAAVRMTSAMQKELKDCNAVCKEALTANDCEAYSRANEEFHFILYQSTGNAFLEAEAKRLFSRLKPFRRVQFKMRGRMAASVSEHDELIDAISRGEDTRAADVLRGHIGTQGDRFYPQMAQLRRDPDLRIAS